MMKIKVDRFDKVKAENDALRQSLKQKDEDIAGIITHIVGEYEKATLKARYKILKEYKQGLLVDANVVEEIKLYEESFAKAKASTSAPRMTIEPPSSVVPLITDELNPAVCKP